MKERYLAGVCDMVLDRLISVTAFFGLVWFRGISVCMISVSRF